MEMSDRATKIWEEIAQAEREEHPTEHLQDGELTVKMFVEMNPGSNESAAREYLNKLVREGKLVRRQVKIKRSSGYAYRPVELDQNKT